MGTNCAPLLADLYLFFYEYKFMESLTKKQLHLARMFNHTYRYIDDLLSVNNPKFADYVKQIYPPFLELKNATDAEDRTSYLDLLLYRGSAGELKTELYDKRDDFNFSIVNYPFISSNIPIRPAYGVYVSRLVAFGRACSDFEQFSIRHCQLATKLIRQGYSKKQLQRIFIQFTQKHGALVDKYHQDLQAHIRRVLKL